MQTFWLRPKKTKENDLLLTLFFPSVLQFFIGKRSQTLFCQPKTIEEICSLTFVMLRLNHLFPSHLYVWIWSKVFFVLQIFPLSILSRMDNNFQHPFSIRVSCFLSFLTSCFLCSRKLCLKRKYSPLLQTLGRSSVRAPTPSVCSRQYK